jgi:hypothetical protein
MVEEALERLKNLDVVKSNGSGLDGNCSLTGFGIELLKQSREAVTIQPGLSRPLLLMRTNGTHYQPDVRREKVDYRMN